MGAKHSFRSPGWGGYPFLYALYIANGALFHPAAPSPFPAPIVANFQQNRAKVRFYLLALVFSRENRRPKTAKFKIYLIFGDCRASVVALSLGRWWCPLGAGGAGLRGFRTCHRLPVVLWWCVPCLLVALLLFPCRVACKYGSISRFKGVFSAFCGACVGLCCFGALRGLWGFCTRE